MGDIRTEARQKKRASDNFGWLWMDFDIFFRVLKFHATQLSFKPDVVQFGAGFFLCLLSLFCFSVPVSPQRRVKKAAFSQITPACFTEHSKSPVMFWLLRATVGLAAARGGKNRRIGQGSANHHAGILITRASLGTMR
tara:strand:- start:51 stop:464 length:414 start_codon:yes stop_codon:yes gene_type:complete